MRVFSESQPPPPTRFPCYVPHRPQGGPANARRAGVVPAPATALATALQMHLAANILRNVSHTIRTINNDYNGRYGRPIVWKERAREHATGPNQTKSCSSLLFPSLSLSVGVRTKRGSPPPFLSLPLAFRRRRAQRERCPNTKRNVIIHS